MLFAKHALLMSPETGLAGEYAASSGDFSSAVAAGDGVQPSLHSPNLPRSRVLTRVSDEEPSRSWIPRECVRRVSCRRDGSVLDKRCAGSSCCDVS